MNRNLRLISKARSAGFLFPLIVLFGFLAGGLVVWQSWWLSGIVKGVFLDQQTLTQIVPMLRWVLLLVVARALFTFINETLAGKLAVRVKNGLREELLYKIDRLGPAFLKDEKAGELATTALQGLDALDAYFAQYLPQILLAALLPLLILIVVLPIDLLTGIVFVATAPLIPFFMVWIGKLSQNHTRLQWKQLSHLGAYFLDTLQGLTTLMTLGRSRERADEVREVSERYRTVTMNVMRITFLSAFVLEMIATLSTALVAVEIGLRLLYSRIAFQEAFFILLIAPEFYLPLRNLSLRYHAAMSGVTAAGRIFDLLDTPEPVREKLASIGFSNPVTQDFSIEMRDVSFAYASQSIPAVEGLTLKIEAGRHYALVGETGAGKSTLVQLLMRFIDPQKGVITFNGVDLLQWDVTEWRRLVAWVPQQPKLFNASLLENVRLRDERVSRSAVEEALQKASLDTLVSRLPQGLDTELLEGGARLSGGEIRRVVLARAFHKDAPLLIMDEPTAHLDLELEHTLIETTQRLMAEKTSLVIAHRLSTVLHADTIFVLRQGRLVEQGTHAELSARAGEYTRLLGKSGGQM